jgi:DNA-binding HxlR family transcriptional regulator
MQAKRSANPSSVASGELKRSSCPISFALEIFGDRWTLLVLRDMLLESRTRFRELLAGEEGIATNVLADRLKRLERRGLIRKERDREDARQFVYKPTERAASLVPTLLEMAAWGARTNSGMHVKPDLLRRFERDRETVINEIQERLRKEGQRE